MIHLKKIDNIYEVLVNGSNKLIGHFIMSDDGFYSFSSLGDGLWSDYALIEIGNKLKELNRPWLEKINEVL